MYLNLFLAERIPEYSQMSCVEVVTSWERKRGRDWRGVKDVSGEGLGNKGRGTTICFFKMREWLIFGI